MKVRSLLICLLAVVMSVSCTIFLFACDQNKTPAGDERALSSIAITTAPTKLAYTVGEKFDATGMVVTATYSDDTTEVVTTYTVDKTEALAVTDTAVTVTYEGKTAVQTITVTAIPQIASIKVATAPTKTTYFTGENFDATGMVVKAVYDNNTEVAISDYVIGKSKNLQPSDTAIVINYNGKVARQTIVVTDPAVTSISVTTNPTKTDYIDGETFDTTGMVVVAMLEDNTQKPITDYTVDKTTLSASDTTVTISYGGKTATVAVTVMSITVSTIEITQAPTKVVYEDGELFDTTGMVVKANYSNDTSAVVTDYTVDKTEGLAVTDTQVTISYLNKTAIQAITVNQSVVSTFRIEAEAIEASNGLEGAGSILRGDEPGSNNPSGTGFLAGWAKWTLSYNVTSNKTTTAELYMCGSCKKGTSTKPTALFGTTITVNEESVTLDPDAAITVAEEEISYFEWKNIKIADITLKPGNNVISFNSIKATNWDYIELKTSAKVALTAEVENGHNFTDWNVITAPTDTTEGLMSRYCTVCRKYEEVVLPVLTSDAYTIGEAVAATELTRGTQSYIYRDADSKEYSFKITTAPATGATNAIKLDLTDDAKIDPIVGTETPNVDAAADYASVMNGGSCENMNKKGANYTFKFTAEKAATVTVSLRLARNSARVCYPEKNMELIVNGKGVSIDPNVNASKWATGDANKSYFDFVDVKLNDVEVSEGENVIVLSIMGSPFTNIDYLLLESATVLTPVAKS